MGNATRTVEGVVNAVVYLVAFAVFNAGCVCWLKNERSMAVVEIVATRIVFASCGSVNARCQIW